MESTGNGVEVLRMHRLSGESNTKAFVDVSFAGVFVVKGLRVIEGKKGLFVAMPSKMGKDEKWHDTAYPLTKDFREMLSGIVLEAYEQN